MLKEKPTGRTDRTPPGGATKGWRHGVGATVEPGGVRFRVWAPTTRQAEVVVYHDRGKTAHPMAPEEGGYHAAFVPGATAGCRYKLRLDGALHPDPASRAQPEGVHGPSEVVDPHAFRWTDQGWGGTSLDDLVIYELHVGTFTQEGTFDAAIHHLDHVAGLGVTAIELMPVAGFGGTRNWGYDGAFLFAPAEPYGGPEGLRRLVDAAHRRGLGVLLDVVYNHFGPEGNHLPAVTGGRFFTERHATPWGAGIDYDGPGSRPIRDFVVQNALHWAHEYHLDGLRLDAAHAIMDDSPVHILQEIAEALHGLDRPRLVIAEDDRNERRLLLPGEEGGYGLDAVWADDLHHQLRRMAAGDDEGYYRSYAGTMEECAETLRRGWLHEGQWSEHQGAVRGTSAEGLAPPAFVHCVQNHDQVGNRAMGDRITETVPLPVFRAMVALLLVSPYTPLLWMGQEWAATSPFRYFTDHPEALGRLVTEGRREEFRHFSAFADEERRTRIPDPQAERTFLDSKLRWSEAERPPHRGVLELHRTLLHLRRGEPALCNRERDGFDVEAIGSNTLALRRWAPSGQTLLAVVHLGAATHVPLGEHAVTRPPAGRSWAPLLCTEEARFGGAGVGASLVDGESPTLALPGASATLLRG